MLNYRQYPSHLQKTPLHFRRLFHIGLIIFLQLIIQAGTMNGEETRISIKSLPVIKKIGKNETHEYSIELKANQLIRFKFEKGDLRFVFDAFDTEGKPLFHGFYVRYGIVEPWFISSKAGIYRFRVTSVEKNLISYSYKFEITERRTAGQNDFIAVAAEEKFQQAEELRAKWGADSLKSALNLYDEAGSLWQRRKMWKPLADALEQSGEIYLIFGEYRKSLEFYRKALDFSRMINDKSVELRQFCNLAKIYYLLGELKLAKKYLLNVQNQINTIALRPDSPLVAEVFSNLGEVLAAEGDLPGANKLFDRSLKIWRNLKHRQGEAATILNLGYTNIDAGEIIQAEKYFDQSLILSDELDDLRGEALTLTGQAHLRAFFLQFEDALGLHSQALDDFKFIGDRQGEAVVFHGIGNIYESLNRPGNAIDSYDEAFQINKKLGNQSYLAVTAFALARAHRLNNDFEEAEKYFQESLDLCLKVNKTRLRAYILSLLAGLQMDFRKDNTALDNYRQTIRFYQKIGDRRGEAFTLEGIGNFYLNRDNLQDAEKHYLEAFQINSKIEDDLSTASIYYHLSQIEFQRGNLPKARSLIEDSLRLTDLMREKLRNPTLRTSYQATNQEKIELLIDILAGLYKKDPRPELLAEMIERVEERRARVLFEILNETSIEPRYDSAPDLFKLEKELQNKLAREIEKVTSLRMAVAPAEEIEKSNHEINSLTEEYDRVQTKIKAADPRYEKIVFPPPVRLSEIQDALQKEPDTVYLSYFLSSPKSYVWSIGKSEILFFELEGKDKLETEARELYRLLTARQRRTGESDAQVEERVRLAENLLCGQSEKLSRYLLGQLTSSIKGKRLLISLDGALQYIPFEALPSPGQLSPSSSVCAQGNMVYEPILKSNEVVYIPSFSILNILRQNQNQRSQVTQNDALAIWTDPVYEPDDPRLNGKKTSKVQASADSEASGNEPPLMPLGRLFNTKAEGKNISELWDSESVVSFTGSRATKQKIEDENLSKYRFLHIAAHGLFNTLQPEHPGLVFSQFDEEGNRLDGLLSLKDIFQIRLNADLVVLSACQSGLGAEFPGEGLTGLKYGFFYAGTQSVVAGLWQVDDKSTAVLMEEFYRALREDQLTAPAALQQAKLKIYEQPGRKSPFYWAAFTMNGEYLFAKPAPGSDFAKHYLIFSIIIFSSGVIFFCFYHIKKRR